MPWSTTAVSGSPSYVDGPSTFSSPASRSSVLAQSARCVPKWVCRPRTVQLGSLTLAVATEVEDGHGRAESSCSGSSWKPSSPPQGPWVCFIRPSRFDTILKIISPAENNRFQMLQQAHPRAQGTPSCRWMTRAATKPATCCTLTFPSSAAPISSITTRADTALAVACPLETARAAGAIKGFSLLPLCS